MVLLPIDMRFVPVKTAVLSIVILDEREVGGFGPAGAAETRLAVDMVDPVMERVDCRGL